MKKIRDGNEKTPKGQILIDGIRQTITRRLGPNEFKTEGYPVTHHTDVEIQVNVSELVSHLAKIKRRRK